MTSLPVKNVGWGCSLRRPRLHLSLVICPFYFHNYIKSLLFSDMLCSTPRMVSLIVRNTLLVVIGVTFVQFVQWDALVIENDVNQSVTNVTRTILQIALSTVIMQFFGKSVKINYLCIPNFRRALISNMTETFPIQYWLWTFRSRMMASFLSNGTFYVICDPRAVII
jgi:hypothetical protein